MRGASLVFEMGFGPGEGMWTLACIIFLGWMHASRVLIRSQDYCTISRKYWGAHIGA